MYINSSFKTGRRVRSLGMLARAMGLLCVSILLSCNTWAQQLDWLQEFGSGEYDEAFGVATDSTGVYVTGRIKGALPGQTAGYDFDAYLRKYDFQGKVIWTRQFEVSKVNNTSIDEPFSVAVDASGVYVAGACSDGAFVSRFDLNGKLAWTYTSNSMDIAWKIVAHSSGLYIAGEKTGVGGGPVIAKLDNDGNEIWRYALGVGSRFSEIAVNDTGVYGVGFIGSADIRALDLDGNALAPIGAGDFRGSKIAGDSTGMYVIGTDIDNITHYKLRKYARSGALLWEKALVLQPQTIDVDDGGVYLVLQVDPGYAVSVARYTTDGDFVWQGEFGDSMAAYGSAVHNGRVYVGGADFGPLEADTNSFLASFSPTYPPQIKALGLINGAPAIAVLVHDSATSTVTIKVKNAQTRQLINTIKFAVSRHPQGLVVVPDINGNGAPELALLGVHQTSGDVTAEIRDALSGAWLGLVSFDKTYIPRQFALVPDIAGGDHPDLAVLGDSSVDRSLRAEVRDTVTGADVSTVGFSRSMYYDHPFSQLAVLPDANKNGGVELAVAVFPTRDDYFATQHIPVSIKEALSGASVTDFYLAENYALLDFGSLPDLNGNGNAEVGTLELGVVRRGIRVGIYDGRYGSLIKYIYYSKAGRSVNLITLPDLNGNGSAEAGVLALDVEKDTDTVEIKDLKTKQWIRKVWFPHKGFINRGVDVLPDLNGNGSAELAQLQERKSDGKIRVVIKDSRTGALIRYVGFY